MLLFTKAHGGEISLQSIDESITQKSFQDRVDLLIKMGCCIKDEKGYHLSTKGEKIIRKIMCIRKLFRINSLGSLLRCWVNTWKFKMISLAKKFAYSNNRKMLLLVIFALFFYIFYLGLELNLQKDVSNRIRFHALPVAMSVLYHHHPHDYTGLKSLSGHFKVSDPIEVLIKMQNHKIYMVMIRLYYWVADDKGFEDYIIAAFYLFSAKLNSLYYMWFLILFTSTAIFSIFISSKNVGGEFFIFDLSWDIVGSVNFAIGWGNVNMVNRSNFYI